MVMITNSFDKFPNEPTGLMYEQFGKIGLNTATPTFEDDFTSDNSVDQDASKISVNTAQERWDFNIVNDQTNDSSSIDITTALSDTNWVMDFDYTWTSLSGTTNVNTSFFGISNSNGTVPSQTAQDHIGVRLQTGSGFSIAGCHSNNGTMQSGLSATFTTIPSVTTLYFRIVRTSTTSMTVKIYTTSARTTVSEEKTVAVSASTTGLRYVKISPYEGTNGGSNTEVGYVKNLKIYNAITSVTSLKVKQHFIDWFSGKQSSSHWALTHPSGSGGTFVGKDEVNGGMIFTSGTSGNNNCVWWFNNKRQYNPTGFIQIAVWRNDPTSSGHSYNQTIVGMSNASDNGQYTYWQFNGATAYFRIRNRGSGSAGALIDSSVTKDQVFHKFKIEGKSASLEYSIDDALEITRTSELPSVALQPIIKGDNSGQNPLVGAIRYMEIYNT